MKDLRKDIKERLTELEAQRASLQKKLENLNLKEDSLKVLLEAEDERWTEQLSLDSAINTKSVGKHTRLYNFIITSLSDRDKSKDEILKEVILANVPMAGKRTKVAVHFTLIGMLNAGTVERVGDLWRLKQKEEN